MNRHTQLLLLDAQGRERSNYRLSYGANWLVKDGAKVEAGQRMVEWDPYTLPIVSEVAGVVDYVDLTDGVSMREVTDEATGITPIVKSLIGKLKPKAKICAHASPCAMRQAMSSS